MAGLILARGGSQGIPLKNLAPLGGRPLLEWALGAMLNFGQFDSIWVSTDHPGIATCASALGVQVFARSAKFASSEAASVDAVDEFLLNHQEVDIVALVQCTSPFLRPGMLYVPSWLYTPIIRNNKRFLLKVFALAKCFKICYCYILYR